MSSEKFTGSRGIIPLVKARVRVPNWILAFNVPGLPYSEPSFTSIGPRKDPITKPLANTEIEKALTTSRETPDVLGIAYLITQEQYNHVLATEGGGIMYADIELDAVPVTAKDAEATGPALKVRTLVVVPMMKREPWPLPSERYMVSSLFRPAAYIQLVNRELYVPAPKKTKCPIRTKKYWILKPYTHHLQADSAR
jgi:hypothetical protein